MAETGSDEPTITETVRSVDASGTTHVRVVTRARPPPAAGSSAADATVTAAAAPADQAAPIAGSARLTMWLLMLLPWLACHAVRKGLPILIEFICQDLGYSDTQKAQLLGAFFPGCAHTKRQPARPACLSSASGCCCC